MREEGELVMDTICRRDIKLSDYNISRAKYNELKYFCIQYAEKKQKLQDAYGLKYDCFSRRWTGRRSSRMRMG